MNPLQRINSGNSSSDNGSDVSSAHNTNDNSIEAVNKDTVVIFKRDINVSIGNQHIFCLWRHITS